MKVHLQKVFDRCVEQPVLVLEQTPSMDNELWEREISPKEIRESIKRLKANRAPGRSGVDDILMKAAGEPLVEFLVEELNKIWKGDKEMDRVLIDTTVVHLHKKGSKSDPNNYRCIFLTETVGKILTFF